MARALNPLDDALRRLTVRALLQEAGPHDLDEARAALQLITERGYQRGKQLLDELQQLMRETETSQRP